MGIKEKVFRFLFKNKIGKVKSQKFWKALYNAALIGMNIGGGGDLNSSGESGVLAILNDKVFKGKENLTLFDVGANIGEYTNELLSIFPTATVHSFEPAAYTFAELKKNVNSDRAIINNMGLSDKRGNAVLYYDEEASGAASLYKRQMDYHNVDFSLSEEVKISTVEDYCNEKKIEYIDFLKIDVEGNEIPVLKGAEKLLNSRKVSAIQIEFGGANIDSRTYFRDFWNLLNENYHVFRIVIDGIYEITKYEEQLEIFTCTNFLFLLKS